jgi:hypothetical protein
MKKDTGVNSLAGFGDVLQKLYKNVYLRFIVGKNRTWVKFKETEKELGCEFESLSIRKNVQIL